MKLNHLLMEGLKRYPKAQVYKHPIATLYVDGEDRNFYIAIYRGDGKITSIKTERPEMRIYGNIMLDDNHVGEVTLGVWDDYTPIRLINIEINDGNVEANPWEDDEEDEADIWDEPKTRYDSNKDFRRKGLATRVVGMLASIAPNHELIINDIQNDAKPFWESLGIEYFQDQGRSDMISGKVRV
jgi:hypothetical protein